jgi:hypothetical protein
MTETIKTKNVVVGLILLIGPTLLILISLALNVLGLVDLHWDAPMPGFKPDSLATVITSILMEIALIAWLPALIIGIGFTQTRKKEYAKN